MLSNGIEVAMKGRITLALVLLALLAAGTAFAYHPRPDFSIARPLPAFQPERADSAHGFDVTRYEITLAVNDQTHFISGSVKAHVTAEENLAGIDYNLIGLTVSQVKVNDVASAFTHQNGILHISLTAAPGQQFTTEVSYSGTPSLSPPPYNLGMIFGSNTVFTLSDPDASRYWWPCYDHPWDKAIMDLHITLRSDWLVACNGLRDSITDNGDGTKTHHWLGSNPMAPYLACVTAGPYVEINQTCGALPIQNFVLPSQYNNALIDFSTLPEIIQFFSSVYGPYPFEKYGNTAVNMTTYGAMEHQTMTTLGNYLITGTHSGELTIAHELAHQWFGNCLTPLTFKDVWLSEGFATYSEFLWTHAKFGWQSACNYMQSSFHDYYISFENSNPSLPNIIYDPPFNYYFYPQSYEKAASVLHMLRLKMGNAAFFQLLQNWFAAYHNGNVVTAELQAMAEQLSGQDLDQFFEQWIYSRGIPEMDFYIFRGYSMIPEMRGLRVVGQTHCSTGTEFTCEVPFRIRFDSNAYDSLNVTASPGGQATTQYYYTMTEIGETDIQIDPNYWVLNRGYNLKKPVLTQALAGNGTVYLNWEAFPCPHPITGYRIQRKAEGSLIWQHIDPGPVSELWFTDTTAVNGTQYQYRITAVDADGFYSLPSNELSATPLAFPFDWGMLVVDETKDGTGAAITPDDATVDGFYAAALAPIPYTGWDYAALGAPSLSTLSHYPIVLWHADDFAQNQIGACLSTLGGYLMGGGKLVISGWKTPGSLSDSFTDLFLDGAAFVYDNGAVLIAALSDTYPQLSPDPDKLTAQWNGMLPMIYTFQSSGQALYTASMAAGAAGAGLPLAVRFDDPGTFVLFGFPLYFMQADGVRNLLQLLLPQLHSPLPASDATAAEPAPGLAVYPNPARGSVNISLGGKPSGQSSLKIYNAKGRLVATLDPAKAAGPEYHLTWKPQTSDGKDLPRGLYFIRLSEAGRVHTRKLLLVR